MKRIVLCVVLLADGPLAGAPAPLPKSVRGEEGAELKKLEGRWEMIGKKQHGEEKTASAQGEGFWQVIRGDRIEWHRGQEGSPIVESIRLYPRASPKGIDLACVRTGRVERGVYRLEGDTLTIVTSPSRDNRPASLEGRRGESITVLRRSCR